VALVLRPPSRKQTRRRGVTLLETVAATAILSVLAVTVISAINGMNSSQDRHSKQLAAMELANRLLLQYLDDPKSMPGEGMPIASGNNRYRWRLEKKPVTLTPARSEVAAERATRSTLTIDRIELIGVSVWLSEESGGSYAPNSRVPFAQLARLADPIADAYRNPDSAQYMLSTDEGKRRLLDRFRDVGSGGLMQRGQTPPSVPKTAPPPQGDVKPTPAPKGGSKPGGKGGPTGAAPGKQRPNPVLDKRRNANPRSNEGSGGGKGGGK
jgi:prepilin-type N-terminal cleavage/methylation domain-containing protein